MFSHHNKPHDNNLNNPNNPNTYTTNSGSGYGDPSNPSYSNTSQSAPSSNISHTFDADKDRARMNIDRNLNRDMTGTQYGTETGTGTYGTTGPYGTTSSTGTTGMGSQYGTGTQPYNTSGIKGRENDPQYGTTGTTGTTGLIGSKYPEPSYSGTQQPTSGATHHARTGTQYAESQQPRSGTQYAESQQPYSGSQQPYTGTQQPYRGTQQPYSGTQQPYSGTQQPYSGTQQPYGTTSGTGAPGVKSMQTVQSVTQDVQAQIDAQAEEAIRKSRELSAQDQARLQASIREATSSLEEQARQLKQQIDQERLAAEQHIKQTQQQKLSATAQQQQLEEQKILEAAAKRKLELEQRAMRLQQEIDEIVRQKTQQMMQEKPGNLCFTHQHQDTTVGAQLAGEIGHILDLKNSGRVSEATMNPITNQQQQMGGTGTTGTAYPVQSQIHTVQGPETHEKKGGFFHALKTALTGKDTSTPTHTNAQTGTMSSHTGPMGTNTTNAPMGTTTNAPMGTNTGTGTYPSQVNTTGMKQQPMMGNRNYDQQSTWASDADKHVPTQ